MYRSSSRYLASPNSSHVSPMLITGRAGWLGGVHWGRISTYSVLAQPLVATEKTNGASTARPVVRIALFLRCTLTGLRASSINCVLYLLHDLPPLGLCFRPGGGLS